MKKIFLLFCSAGVCCSLLAQHYPEPQYANEVSNLKKDTGYSLVRLEKGYSKLESKAKVMGGAENSFSIEGTRSPIRLKGDTILSFVFSNGNTVHTGSSKADSMIRANGVDPSMLQGMMGMQDPSSMISLYKTDGGAGERKVILQKTGPALPFSKHKVKVSEKFTFSVQKIKDGYWIISVDKLLQPGEYAFTMMSMGMDGVQSAYLFAFGVD